MSRKSFDILVIGGGIVGTSVANSLLKRQKLSVLLIEEESKLAQHQTGNNSGVIHSGIYYKPGSLKAKNCSEGRELLYEFCEQYQIPFEKCGKVIVAVNENEIPALNDLQDRGIANGLGGLKKLNFSEIREYEPYSTGVAGLFVPQTGIVDYTKVTNKFAELFISAGGLISTECKFQSIKSNHRELTINTNHGDFKAKLLINCGGLYSDRIAKLCGVKPGLQIIPFRGEYYKLKREKEYLVRNLIYPVPDPRFPFLGVHFTRIINGGIEVGPNAVLAFKREGYNKSDLSIKDIAQMMSFSGFWKMASKYYKMGFEEFSRSYSKKAFVKALKKLIPKITENDIEPAGSGVRAQALTKDGKLVDDFRIVETERTVHVLNAPSPAATASISIGNKIAEMVIKKFDDILK